MVVYVIRHGKTHRDSQTGRDADRVLKERGHAQSRALAVHLRDDAPERPSALVSSPWTRAAETAAPIWDALGLERVTDPRLQGDRSVDDMLGVLHEHGGHAAMGIVSHNPIVSRLVDLLVGGAGARHAHTLRTGELVAVRLEPGDGAGADDVLGTGRVLEVFRHED